MSEENKEDFDLFNPVSNKGVITDWDNVTIDKPEIQVQLPDPDPDEVTTYPIISIDFSAVPKTIM